VSKPKVVALCGSTRFIDIMAVCAWLIERDENAITLSCHLLPQWYGAHDDHQAEAEGVKEKMDELHLRKIELADEVFIVNPMMYVGESTSAEIEHARNLGRPIRYYTFDPIGKKVREILGPRERS
jgi:hypothetical protein